MTEFFNPLVKETATQRITVHCGGHACVQNLKDNPTNKYFLVMGMFKDEPDLEPELKAFWDEKRELLKQLDSKWK